MQSPTTTSAAALGAEPAFVATPALIAAAVALLDYWQAGVIVAAPMAPSFQRYEIDREFRVDSQILCGPGAADCAVVALTCVACFRRGIETGVLVVTNDTATPHVTATIVGVAAELDKTEASDGPLASLWFDPPVVIPPAE